MMKRFRRFIEVRLTGKFVIVAFIVVNVIYGLMLFVTIPATMDYADGMKLLDMLPMGYDAHYIEQLFKALGSEGRDSYLYRQIPMDMIYPFCFAISYSLLIGYLLKRIDKLDSPLFYFTLLPVIAGLSDYLENLGIISLLRSYPNLSVPIMEATSLFSMVKSSTTTVFFVSLLIFLFLFLRKIFTKNH